MNRAAKIATGVGAVAVLGAAAIGFYLREETTEHAGYTLEIEDGAFSVRRYPALLVAETQALGDRDRALNTGFNRLAGYIFAKDRPDADRRAIAMTAPVLSDRTGDRWRTRFVMPRGETADALPAPGPDVDTAILPARRVVAIRFSGRASDAQLQDAERRLRAWALERGLTPVAPAEYAFYNSPMIPGPLRRNEVLLPIGG